MSTTAAQMRNWKGPAVLSYGFRPFFLLAGLWACLAMVLWVAMLSGWLSLPTAFDPVSWHAHEFLFGYLGAVAAGFLLTAVPNWTGRLPVVGWSLGALAGLWVLGRVAILVSASFSPLAVALADLAFPVCLAAVLAREIIAGRNWRNLVVLGMLGALTLANALFHWQAAGGAYAAGGTGLRLGTATGVVMITVIGGRIVPSFTRNWLVRQGKSARPVPVNGYDKAVILATVVALLGWVIAPNWTATGFALILTGILQTVRLARWAGRHTGAEPLVWILHVGYGFVPLGALTLGVAILRADETFLLAAQHLWMAGAIGVMTVAVMTRATLGHTNKALSAGAGTTAIYLALIASVLIRLVAGFFPDTGALLTSLAGAMWIAAFLGFALIYGPGLVSQGKEK